ncbi:MAG TPA: hypothetical protein VME18_05970 [Acidobacteriaceae bacterium]|nr:hypothetical protein [Acidobacteriaceae bacterium]
MTNPAAPGTLNYVEGSAKLGGRPVTQSSVGSPAATLQAGQVLSTTDSRAEVLLTPGIYLRLGHNSAVEMISPDLTDTAVAVERGRVDVEVDQLFQENNIHILLDHVPVQLVKTGIYEFNARRDTVMVFEGMAVAMRPNEKWVKVKNHHALELADLAKAKPRNFNVSALEQSGLYRWSSLRSDYLAEDNQEMAGEYGYGYAPGWYWDPYAWDYTFLGPYGFYSPFGWGFAPFGWGPGWGWGWGGWGYPGFYGGGYYGRGNAPGPHGPVNLPGGGFGGGARPGGGFRGNAFRAGGEMGGFHGGGGLGGFHGGGFGGGGHGR